MLIVVKRIAPRKRILNQYAPKNQRDWVYWVEY